MSDSNPRPPRALPSMGQSTNPRPTRALPPLKAESKQALETEPTPRRTPRRKKQRQDKASNVIVNPDATMNDALDNTDQDPSTPSRSHDNEAPQSRERRRPRRNRSPRATTSAQPADTEDTEPADLMQNGLLSAMENQDQVVSVNEVDEPINVTNLPGIAHGSGGSALTDRVYVQTTSGFVTRNREWIDKRNSMAADNARVAYGEERVSPFDIAEQNEKGFMFITLILHGALAGMSIWHAVFCYSLYQPSRTQNFLMQYQTLAMPAQTIYYIILTLCVVSALDRYDYASKDKHIFHSLAKFDLASVSVVLYYISFLFSVGLVGLDAWIQSGVGIVTESPITTTTTSTVSTTTLPPELTGALVIAGSSVNTWLIINVLRAVFASLGWLVVAFDPLRNDMKWDR